MKAKESARIDLHRLSNKINLLRQDLGKHLIICDNYRDRISKLEEKRDRIQMLLDNGVIDDIDKYIKDDYRTEVIN